MGTPGIYILCFTFCYLMTEEINVDDEVIGIAPLR